MSKSKIKREDLEPLVLQGLTDREIAKILGFSMDGIYNARKNIYKIERESLNEAKYQQPTQRQLEILLGTWIGDSSIKLPKNSKNPSISCEHGKKQVAYNQWKFNELRSLNATFRIAKRKTIDPRTNIYYESSILRLPSNPFYMDYYNMLYSTGAKQLIPEYFKDFSELSLAVFYMDDGSKTNHSLRICKYSFTEESLFTFITFTKNKWNMDFNIDKKRQLYLPAKYYSLFQYLVLPHIHETMKYKLHLVS